MDPILIFLAIALIIIAMAFLLSLAFRKTIKRDGLQEKSGESTRDGDAIATWTGINAKDPDH